MANTRNSFGMFLRMIREENGLRLYDMAKDLNVSSAFLSAIENSRKQVPMELVHKIIKIYKLNESATSNLIEAARHTITSFNLKLNVPSPIKANLAASLARSFDSLNDEEIKKIQKILNKYNKMEG